LTKIGILFSLSAALMSAFIFGIPFDNDLHKAWSFGQQGGNVSSLALPQVPAASSSSEGDIASIQNNQSGKPTWILEAGGWQLLVPKPIQVSETVVPVNSGVIFSASFEMTRLDGTEGHRHVITDFVLTKFSTTNTVKAYDGTATVTLKDGPHTAVPISIRIMNDHVMSLWIDPTKTNNHFGNTPIYGKVRTSGIFSSFSG
jgi:hypothetical protein